MPHIKAKSGIDWHYEIRGEGEPLVFLHGWGVSSRIWHQQVKQFSKTHAVINFDLPGHGKSGWKKMELIVMAEDLKQILTDLGVQRFTVVASSFGGLLAIKLVEMCPGRIKRLVLVGSQPKFSQSYDYPFGLEVERIKKLAGQLETDYEAMIKIFFRSLFTKEERATRRFKWIQTFRKDDTAPDMEAALGILEILEKEDLRRELIQIDIPMQFIYGEEDYICPKYLYADLMELLPNARFDSFAKIGHFPFLINPHDFNEVLEEFLTS